MEFIARLLSIIISYSIAYLLLILYFNARDKREMRKWRERNDRTN